MSDPNDERQSYPLKTRILAGFLLAALAAYIPIAALGVYILVDLRINPQPPPALGGIGAALCLFIVGPLCSLVAGVVGAYLAGYRQVDLRWMVFCLLVGVSLAIVAIMAPALVRLLPR